MSFNDDPEPRRLISGRLSSAHLGSVGVGSSLEVDDAVGIGGLLLGVLLHGPLLQLGPLILTQFHIRVFHGQAGGKARMLPDQPPTAAPVDMRPSNLCLTGAVMTWLSLGNLFNLPLPF